jgi:hypothetical protein
MFVSDRDALVARGLQRLADPDGIEAALALEMPPRLASVADDEHGRQHTRRRLTQQRAPRSDHLCARAGVPTRARVQVSGRPGQYRGEFGSGRFAVEIKKCAPKPRDLGRTIFLAALRWSVCADG